MIQKVGFSGLWSENSGNSGENDVTVGSPIFRQTQIFGSSVWWEQDDKWSHVTFHSSGLVQPWPWPQKSRILSSRNLWTGESKHAIATTVDFANASRGITAKVSQEAVPKASARQYELRPSLEKPAEKGGNQKQHSRVISTCVYV